MAKNENVQVLESKGVEEETEQLSLKDAIYAVQSKFEKDVWIGVEYITKKGKELSTSIKLLFGRKKKLKQVIMKMK